MTVAAATALLESAGFVAIADPETPPLATVAMSQPGAGVVLRVGVSVALVADTPTPVSQPGATESPAP